MSSSDARGKRLHLLRSTVAGALTGSARLLSLAARIMDATAKTITPLGDAASPRESEPAAQTSSLPGDEQTVGEQWPRAEPGRVHAVPDTPLLDESPQQRRSESHVAELAARPVAEVVAAVESLSTDELRELTEYETAHRNRKTVLRAVERAATPPGEPGG